MPFACVVLEAADAVGGPAPALLHSLREQGCRLILAQGEEGNGSGSAPLNKEWFDAVFDKVVSLDGHEGSGQSALERYLSDVAIAPLEVLCFACSERGTAAFAAVDAGLIVAPVHDHVWRFDKNGAIRLAGADIAAHESPSARQLAWLHTVFTAKMWCACLFLFPPPDEFHYAKGQEGASPSASERAKLTAVRSPSAGAQGQPAWAWHKLEVDDEPVCTFTLGQDVVACPDWTPLEPKFKVGRFGPVQELCKFRKVDLYCHTLDVGVAEVNHTVEAVDKDGLRVRVSSKRLVSLARPGHAATELSVVILDPGKRSMPDICFRSCLRLDHVPAGFTLMADPVVDEQHAVLSATYVDEQRRMVTVTAWHRVIRDDGKGELRVCPNERAGNTRVEKASRHWGIDVNKAKGKLCAIDLVVFNPRRGSRYTVEKVVVISSGPAEVRQRMSRSHSFGGRAPSPGASARTSATTPGPYSLNHTPPLLAEIEEEHRSAWRAEWDRADIEVVGLRKAARFQRMVRLFRFHQVSQGEMPSTLRLAKVPRLVCHLFSAIYSELCEAQQTDRPSNVVTSRVLVQDPRTPPVMRIEPNVPPACERLQFNCALGGRWHRFTLTPGTVQILVQGPILGKQAQLYGDVIKASPKFIIPTHESDVGVEIRALPWHEVQVQHSLTDLGRPDGSQGGFYSLMRRSRFTRVEVLRRLLADRTTSEAQEESYNDETLTAPLRDALARLHSAPRPPGWRRGDNEDLHILQADTATRVRVVLTYEKKELFRDITFLEGRFTKLEGGFLGEDLVEPQVMTIAEAKIRCATVPGCRGFSFQGEPSEEAPVKMHFRGTNETSGPGWTSFRYESGEAVLLELLEKQFEEKYRSGKRGVQDDEEEVAPEDYLRPGSHSRVPSWEALTQFVTDGVLAQVGDAAMVERRGGRPFRNFITDRDGTVNNYCDRYSSCVQSAYNAAWLSHFARHCTDNAVFVTAAPLGGRPSAEGLMELCVAPRGEFTYTGSKGREYFDHSTQRVLEADALPQEQRELVDELHRRILALCGLPGNTKFLGIGSGLQRKFGEVTMARNDPAGTVSEPESRRFMAAVRRVKEELDPDGTSIDLHDTGTDMELFPRVSGGRPSFDKGKGVACLDQKLHLQVSEGPNLVCGDTSSDLAMVIATLRLMCGEKMVEAWQERLRREDEGFDAPDLETDFAKDDARRDSGRLMLSRESFFGFEVESTPTLSESAEEAEQRTKDEAERRAKEEEEEREREREAREACSRLAVIFVISPEHHATSPSLVDKVRRWCDICSAHCAIIPSPDVLVAALARYANRIAGRCVTQPALLPTAACDGFELVNGPEAVPTGPQVAWGPSPEAAEP